MVPVIPAPPLSSEPLPTGFTTSPAHEAYLLRLQAWTSDLSAGAIFEGQAQWLEEAARAVLTEAGHDPDAPHLTHFPQKALAAGDEPKPARRDDSGKAVDHADRVLHLVKYARHAITEGKADQAARWALEAGIAAATMFAVHRTGDAARTARGSNQRAARASEHARWRDEAERVKAIYPKETIPRIAGRVSRNLNLNAKPGTVEAVLRKK